MTLSKKFWFWSTTLLALTLFVGVSGILSLAGIWRSARASVAYYQAMDRAAAADTRVMWLRTSLREAGGEQYLVTSLFDPIARDIAGVRSEIEFTTDDVAIDGGQHEFAKTASDRFATASDQARTAAPNTKAALSAAAATELDRVSDALAKIAKLAPDAARRQTEVTIAKVESGLRWTCFWLIVVLILSAAIHYRQYRALVKPLLFIRENMKRSRANGFREEIRAEGDAAFIEVAGFFNGLARDLAQLYRDLEQKVVDRSRALVRSERLASVGFLAAGVAHEINNPLSIISGYAELCAKSLRNVLDSEAGHATNETDAAAEADALGSALETQAIIRDEAFRCKEITNRLLSLARGGTDAREHLRLDALAGQVAVLTKGLKRYVDRRISIDFAPDMALEVVANPTEMKQVLLNLAVNALEASSGDRSEVHIGGRQRDGFVEVFVQDQGKGMTQEALQFIFEPFYTDKRGMNEAGTGLGLSISHAIIENHNGTITAESRGPGTGSRFTIRLPAASAESGV